MKKMIAILLAVLLCAGALTLTACAGKNIESMLIKTGTWCDKDNIVVKYTFNADHTGSFINADNPNNRSDITWSYDGRTKEIEIIGALPDERYAVEVTDDGILLRCLTSYFEIELVPGIPVPDTIPDEGTYPEELVGDLIWKVAEEQTGYFREYEDDYWELHADGSGVWNESVFKSTGVKWIVDSENRLYIERIYDDGATAVKWFTYEPTEDGFMFTNINTGESFPVIKRK